MTVDSRDLSDPGHEFKIDISGDSGTSSITHTQELPSADSDPVGQAGENIPTPAQPVLGDALEAISGDILKKRSLEVSSTSFITIISIILGVGLGLLAQNTFPSPSPLAALQSACLLLLFVLTFYYFLSMSIMLRWAPSFVDCSLPFLIASLEIPPAYFLGHAAAWNGWLAGCFAAVAAGVYSTIKYSPISHFGGDRRAQAMLHRLVRELSIVFVTCSFLLGVLTLLAKFIPAGEVWWGIAGCVVEFATITTIVARMEIQLSRIYAHYGVNRPPFN